MKWARRPDTRPGQWRAASALLHGALRTSGNLLFNNLYATLEVYAEVPFFSESQQSVTGHSFEQEHLGTHRVLDILKTRDPARQHRLFLSYYHDIAQTMEATFSRLREKLPDVAEDSARRFTWSAERGRYPRYLQIALDLVEKIGIGVYPAGTFLPPEVALAKQYGVTADTLRKAIRFLNDIGFAHTRDRVGTYVVSPDRYAYRGHSNKTGILLYLSAVQLMALAIRPAALLVFDRLDAQTLKRGFTRPNSIPLADIVDNIIELMPLQPYRVILLELNNLLNWGFYFSFYSYGRIETDYVVQLSLKAFLHLEKGERQTFADLLGECYCHILTSVRELLIEVGLEEAKNLTTPNHFF